MKNELNRHVLDYTMCDVTFGISDPIEPLREYIVQYCNNAGYGTNYAII